MRRGELEEEKRWSGGLLEGGIADGLDEIEVEGD